MDGKRIAALAALTLLAVVVSATELHCFYDKQLCDKWTDKKDAALSSYKNLTFCCPPELGQALKITSNPPEVEHCTCKVGTAEKYAKLLAEQSKRAGVGNSASGLMPYGALAVILLLIVGVSLY